MAQMEMRPVRIPSTGCWQVNMAAMAPNTLEDRLACLICMLSGQVDMLKNLCGQQQGRPLIKPDRFSTDEIKSLQAQHQEVLRQKLVARGKLSRNGCGLY